MSNVNIYLIRIVYKTWPDPLHHFSQPLDEFLPEQSERDVDPLSLVILPSGHLLQGSQLYCNILKLNISYDSYPLNTDDLITSGDSKQWFAYFKQVCIPVGCVRPACCPYLPACTAPECEQNSWHTLLKILPCPNFVAGGKNGFKMNQCARQQYFPLSVSTARPVYIIFLKLKLWTTTKTFQKFQWLSSSCDSVE